MGRDEIAVARLVYPVFKGAVTNLYPNRRDNPIDNASRRADNKSVLSPQFGPSLENVDDACLVSVVRA